MLSSNIPPTCILNGTIDINIHQSLKFNEVWLVYNVLDKFTAHIMMSLDPFML